MLTALHCSLRSLAPQHYALLCLLRFAHKTVESLEYVFTLETHIPHQHPIPHTHTLNHSHSHKFRPNIHTFIPHLHSKPTPRLNTLLLYTHTQMLFFFQDQLFILLLRLHKSNGRKSSLKTLRRFRRLSRLGSFMKIKLPQRYQDLLMSCHY